MTLPPGATAPDKRLFGAALGEAMSGAAVLLAPDADEETGGVRPKMLFILPKFPMLNSPNSAYHIMLELCPIIPNYAQLCPLCQK